MNDREVRRYAMFNCVLTFGQDNAADFPPTSLAGILFAAMKEAVNEVDVARALQQGARATAREVLLDALRIDLKNIARTAREIAHSEPGFADRFHLPASPAQAALLTAPRAMLVELQKPGVAQKFIAYELPATFVADLTADLARIDASKGDEDHIDTQGVTSTVTLGKAIEKGITIVGQLNAIMHNKYTRNPEKLRAWNSVSHTERTPHREKALPTPTTATANPSPVAATSA